MALTKEQIKVIQHELNEHHNISISVDGIKGPNTMAAIQKINQIPSTWPDRRQLIGVIQYACMQRGIEGGPIDGYWGPMTDHAFELLKQKIETGRVPAPWRDEKGVDDPTSKWPAQDTNALIEFYGDVGDRSKLVDVKVPYTLKLTWNKSVKINQFKCHKLVAPSIQLVLEQVLDHYGIDEIKRLELDSWSGCYAVRKMRGGTEWSTHSWGIAVDWISDKNKLTWGADKATLAKPEYDFWWRCWEDEGWISLGRCKNYDWMHVGATVVKCGQPA